MVTVKENFSNNIHDILYIRDFTDECSGLPDFKNHVSVHLFCATSVGLLGVNAVHSYEHNENLGTAIACGGWRRKTYACFWDMLSDVLKLSGGMSRKSAWARTQSGGTKFVVWDDPKNAVSDEYLALFAAVINRFNGAVRTGEDVGVSMEMVDRLASYTPHIFGSSKVSGDPSPFTAEGVLQGMRACVEEAFPEPAFLPDKRNNLYNIEVAVQGLGKVGKALVARLIDKGARVYVADTDNSAVEEVATRHKGRELHVVPPEKIHMLDVAIYAPCAMGGTINDKTIPQLRCKIVCGSANNQLADPEYGRELARRGILYAPDYTANAGGLINVAREMDPDGYSAELSLHTIRKRIPENLRTIFTLSKATGKSPSDVADDIADERIAKRHENDKTGQAPHEKLPA